MESGKLNFIKKPLFLDDGGEGPSVRPAKGPWSRSEIRGKKSAMRVEKGRWHAANAVKQK
jgi:hypothetical protein